MLKIERERRLFRHVLHSDISHVILDRGQLDKGALIVSDLRKSLRCVLLPAFLRKISAWYFVRAVGCPHGGHVLACISYSNNLLRVV